MRWPDLAGCGKIRPRKIFFFKARSNLAVTDRVRPAAVGIVPQLNLVGGLPAVEFGWHVRTTAICAVGEEWFMFFLFEKNRFCSLLSSDDPD